MQNYLVFSKEVAQAKADGKAIVALESTIISHGMPYPQNVQTAREVEQLIRDNGAVPATIAIIGGKICVGLSDAELEQLASAPEVMKVSRRDLPYVLSTGKLGATTVAATMICAELAGIAVFVTGGIGGVHRGAETSFDISADLQELAQTSVAVVCAGAKSILDLGLTLEYLETHGVPVVSVGQAEFPAFFTRGSGFKADFQLDTATGQADFIRCKWALGLRGGVVIANPVPEAYAMPKAEIDSITEQALQEADAQGINGKAVTPFLLNRIKQLTDGRSLVTNIALVKNNAIVGAALALALKNG
ncbi:pseudouridine-5'-phosphate glycosidase [Undibacterium sp. RTI2.1]|uniref:pseudouridine-5'-phosphate glycosidase n=1 Tax=unclassified Undibacterium TaxID=2630295 RepID=UPI002AB3334B|nr:MULTISPECIES: pseudouridine-5'-phosphate glycosidase [unclassified Undibacterium]MDY7540459.1 pseudouridine-5'-phosphate glycosidase [Undibacterium sp. 5I1]MEB0030658.1 pseudouridine-5'-phosphate glycosidase [Undibacterium sp. RTI2.1]MEB0116599.1 pseudouridine-5'-phosphate glycosidase [Undibacterium sp. RTI2.2]MEB0230080.1 pseudouridine-5'-phosphate glycosidase [Undibacterium sp. 10I3]MEB0257718.1 pseudouridine-5'-phosphate glycosidase [Undibacterium sp. 5I1]